MAALREGDVPNRGRFHPVVVGAPLTGTRDRDVAIVDPDGRPAILAPWGIAISGGDVVATPRWLFADAKLVAKNRGADRGAIAHALNRRFGQELLLLGHAVGDVPRQPIATYLAPLDDRTIAVGDVHLGLALLGQAARSVDDGEAARFDRVAEMLAAKGFRVVRTPALVREGGGAFATYTSVLFDRERDGTRVVYLPTYGLQALDEAAQRLYESEGFVVHAIDVVRLDASAGSLGGLVDVRARG